MNMRRLWLTGGLTLVFLGAACGSDDGGGGGNTGGASGGNTGGASGGNTGGASGGNTGGASGGNTGGASGGNTGGASGGNTGGASGGNTGGASGGNTGGASGGNTGGASGTGGGGSTLHDCSPPSGTNTLKFTQVASGYSRPVWVGNAPGNSERLFVVEQPGRIRIIDNGVKVDQAFLDIASAKVESGGNEQGLLGLAFHPGYATNRRFYVNYTNKDGDTVIAEYQRSASEPDRAEPSSEKILMTVPQPQSNHNGGNLQFGPDGMLYIGLGDGGGGGDQHGANGNGQTLSTLLGKMLRIDVDGSTGGKPYGIPSGNMSGQNVLPEIWSYGLRNPWRWSFDVCTGDLYIGDVGQNTWEEIDVEPAGTGSGTNYGWRVMEGTHCYNPASGCDQSGKTLPVAEYNHSEGCSVTGGFVYRGKNIPALRGAYLYADFCSSQFWSFRYSGGAATGLKEITSEFTSGDVGQISSFGQDAHGELYVTDFGGRVWRIDAG